MFSIRRPIIFSVTAITLLSAACNATKSTTAGGDNTSTQKSKNRTPELLMATSQTEQTNMRETPPIRRFLIVWNDEAQPKSFFWNGENTWEVCSIFRAKNYDPKTKTYSSFMDTNLQISKGDTLELVAISGAKNAVPDEIPTDKSNILYYQQSNGVWKGIPVADITRLTPETVELTR